MGRLSLLIRSFPEGAQTRGQATPPLFDRPTALSYTEESALREGLDLVSGAVRAGFGPSCRLRGAQSAPRLTSFPEGIPLTTETSTPEAVNPCKRELTIEVPSEIVGAERE